MSTPETISDVLCRWGNSSINLKTDSTVIFDASAFYGHNEYEMGNWKPIRSRFNKTYFRTYAKYYSIAQPEEDYDDRILLYSMRFDFQLSILFPGSTAVKNT
jgi:protein-ribulosamine 3-kinase